jgi:hypothetical protein
MNDPGWDTVFSVVRRYDRGELPEPEERRAATASALALARTSVPGTMGCSVTLRGPGGTFHTPVYSGELAQELDDRQYRWDDGPCLNAARHQRLTFVESMATDPRWPNLAGPALERGVHSSYSVPFLAARAPAALNFYGDEQNDYASDEVRARASVISRIVAVLVVDEPGDTVRVDRTRLEQVMSDRSVIDRALGLVMARDDVDVATAYRYLAVRSADETTTLADVARQTVDAAGSPPRRGQPDGRLGDA